MGGIGVNDIMVINGGNRICGELCVQGSKNSVLPILAATIINGGINTIHNCPLIKDVYASFDILRQLGCVVTNEGNTVTVDSKNMSCDEIHQDLMKEMRSSVIFTGALLARCKKALISTPGGCELGPRPIDLHLKVFKSLGVDIKESHGYIMLDGENAHCGDITLDFPSVGATENAMLLACATIGTTVIYNCAQEPEIVDLQDYLNSMGAKIKGAGTSVIEIDGTSDFTDVTHQIIGDRIVATTFLCAAAITKGNVKINGIIPNHINAVCDMFLNCGAKLQKGEDFVEIDCKTKLNSISCISTMPHPGFPTDAQALAVATLSVADGTSIVEENIFSSRFKHVPELNRMNADIIIKDKLAIVRGVNRLKGASVTAYDLRGAAALVVAGLNAYGTTTVSGLEHLDRGYESLEDKLKILGADIKRE